MKFQAAVVFLCAVSLARAMTLRLELESAAVDDWLKPFLDVLNDDWKCSSGECEKCETSQGQTVCVKANLPAAGTIHIVVISAGTVLFQADIKEKNPDPICKPFQGAQLCLIATNVNLQTGSACLEFSITFGGTKYSLPFGCFTLKKAPAATDLVFQAENDHDHDKEDVEIPVDDFIHLFSAFDCKPKKCTICKSFGGRKGCITATLDSDSIKVGVTVSGVSLITGSITAKASGPFCRSTIPLEPRVTDLCLSAARVNLDEHSACLYLSMKVNGVKKYMSVGCFKIPETNDGTNSEIGSSLMTFLKTIGRGQM